MNCHQLQPMLRELAGEAGLEPETRQRAALHLSRCPRCAARLAEERRLTAGLAELAQSMEGREAPAYVEHLLRDAFLARCYSRGRRDMPVTVRDSSETLTSVAKATIDSAAFTARLKSCPDERPGLSYKLSRLWPQQEWAFGLASAAAAILIIVAAALLWRTPAPEAGRVAVEPAPHPAKQATQQATPQAPITAGEIPRPQAPQPETVAEEERRTVAAAQAPEPKEEPKETARAAEGGSDEAELRQPAMAGEGFVPFFYGGDPGLLETGQVLRVELHTGVLESFGIPVHEELRTRRIRADLLVGEDGTARAIRFVH